MGNKILNLFFSTRLMAILFIGFSVAMAAGTLIENDYNTDTARVWVYNAWWFEAIMVLFVINFIGNIPKYRLWKKEKWATLILHLSFIFILIGAGITRYISFEGLMPIDEGATENTFYSDRYFITAFVDGEYKGEMRRREFEKPLILSPVANNDFSINKEFSDKPFTIRYKEYIKGAEETIKPDSNGKKFLKLVESGGGERHEHFLEEGQVENIHNILFAYNNFTQGAINIMNQGESFTIQTPFEGQFMRMADRFEGPVVKDSVQELMFRSLYNLGGSQFVFPELPVNGVKSYKSNGDFKDNQSTDILVVEVESGGKKEEIFLTGSKGMQGEPKTVTINGLDFTLFFGSKVYELPFSIKLDDFIAQKYPGTEKSYESFESKVTVIDEKPFKARIYMNHVLDHKGYRFFQASFRPDEKGTVLSVNHDWWGTNITYLGYFLLFFGLMAIMFTKHSRFAELKRNLEKVKARKAKLAAMILLLFGFQGMAQTPSQNHRHDKMSSDEVEAFLQKNTVKQEHADKFGRLVIQDEGGRMKPVNTFASELLRKVSKRDKFHDMDADQAFLSMTMYPNAWFEVPLVYIKPGNDSIRKILGVESGQKYIPFIRFFDEQFNYKLSPFLDKAYAAAVPSQFEKDFIEADRRVNLLNSALGGSILKIYPIPNDANHKWVSYPELSTAGMKGMDSVFTQQILPMYIMSLAKSIETGNYKEPDFYLDGIKKFQNRYGKDVMPSKEKIDAEIMYNKYDVFRNLYYLYMLAGVLMLLLTIANIFFEKKALRYVINGFHILIGVFFAMHTLGLIARWYISGHAPWSDAYESMIYVAWATMFFTLAFDRKSKLTVASGTFVTSMILMIAHWNWMDPAIANLAPVLNSYWLMIHVAVIVASYGPFTLGMILGIVTLLLMIFTTKSNKQRMELHIKEISYINEMALTIGLILLTIGNFLGGQWANESWGRYWGWDPKETWALISIMVYAFVIHARFVPLFRSRWVFSFLSIIAYYSILMTYFGVNFYLSGLHSYASGDKVVTPTFIYISVACVLLLGAISYWRFRSNKKLERPVDS